MRKKLLVFSSAYSQLILIIFLPIVILAMVGSYLVEIESSKAIHSEQRSLATAVLIRYQPIVKEILPQILLNNGIVNNDEIGNEGIQWQDGSDTYETTFDEVSKTAGQDGLIESITTTGQKPTPNQIPVEEVTSQPLDELNDPSMEEVQSQISYILSSMNNDQHILNVYIVDELGKVVASSSAENTSSWDGIGDQGVNQLLKEDQVFIEGIPSDIGTAYGHELDELAGRKYWLFVDMDNEPLTIGQLKVWLGLGMTGLLTLLILLLSLNIFAKRWIAPIYDLRLYLQRISPDNMYLPVRTNSTGELNQLQQDIVKTFRRLYADFQELKDHSDQTEEDLRDAFDEMEMQNIFIREARDQAVSSSQAKSAFLANISHELRTPLNSIDGFINLLARHGNLTAEQDLYVQTIRKSSAHLLALVNDVLDFSKIEAGKLVLDKHEFSLYNAIYDVMDMLSPLAAQKGLRMAVMYYNDVPNTIIGDALRIKQVLTNLVGNAIKFTDVGEVVVRVGIDEINDASVISDSSIDPKQTPISETAKGGMIHITIQDTGHGISEKAKSQLFNSFSQGDPSVTRQYGGTGLGLVISKQLTKLMGGKIGFYDNNDSVGRQDTLAEPSSTTAISKAPVKTGATFWFSIPSHVDVDTASDMEFGGGFNQVEGEEQIQLPILRPFASKGSDDKPFDMLVWINHGASMQVMMAATRPLNITVTQARSVAGALEKLKEEGNRWDWVVIDGGDSEAHEDMAALLKQIRLHYQGKLAIYGYQVALDATLLERYKALGLYQPLDKRQLYRILDTRTTHVSKIESPPTWQGVTVLAVDDHLPNLLVLDALLGEMGIKVITANSGFDAVDIISQQLTQQLTSHISTNDLTNSEEGVSVKESISDKPSVSVKAEPKKVSPHASTRESEATARTIYENANGQDTDVKNANVKNANEQDANEQDADKDANKANVNSVNKEITSKIDMIFMDIQMPRMSGTEASCKIRELEKEALKNPNSDHKHIPIIALTAHGLADGKDALIAAGIDDYVGKPISRAQLLQILQRWLSRGSATINSIHAMSTHSELTQSNVDHNHIDSNRNNNNIHIESSNNDKINSEHGNGEAPVVDWRDALVRSANKSDLARQLLFMMKESVPNEIRDLKKAWEARDREALSQIAHRILGASRYSGVPQIRQASQNFEDRCLLNVQHTTPTQFNKLEEYYSDLIDSLEKFYALDLETYINEQMQANEDKVLSENDMTWKMI